MRQTPEEALVMLFDVHHAALSFHGLVEHSPKKQVVVRGCGRSLHAKVRVCEDPGWQRGDADRKQGVVQPSLRCLPCQYYGDFTCSLVYMVVWVAGYNSTSARTPCACFIGFRRITWGRMLRYECPTPHTYPFFSLHGRYTHLSYGQFTGEGGHSWRFEPNECSEGSWTNFPTFLRGFRPAR